MRSLMIGLTLGTALVLAGQAAVAQEHEHGGGGEHGGGTHPAPHPPEQHAGPTHYQRVTEPKGWNSRPAEVDRGAYQHNFQAARSYKIGPYHRPPGWAARRWGYGDILPRAYWAAPYLLADYWLFALEVPPAGYEWVRVGADALLVSIATGEVLQAEYGVFG
ncbi:MAG: RcnB family protein [Steroidobacteraceae bacterium]|jgi:Ni/Co efflux regulator RcnB